MASLPTFSGGDYWTNVDQWRPFRVATTERGFAAAPELEYTPAPEAEDLIGTYPVIANLFKPNNMPAFVVMSEATGKNPEELEDVSFQLDTPQDPIALYGVFEVLGMTGDDAPKRKRPAEFLSLASPNVLEQAPTTIHTRPPTTGLKGRNLQDGKVYTYSGSAWVIDDPQDSPPDLIEIPLSAEMPWFQLGDVPTPEMFALIKACAALSRWTFGTQIVIPFATGLDFEDPDWEESMFSYPLVTRNDRALEGPGYSTISNTWISRDWPDPMPPGWDGPWSPGPTSAMSAAVGVADSRIAGVAFFDAIVGTYPTPLFPMNLGSECNLTFSYPGPPGEDNDDDNEEEFYDHSAPANNPSITGTQYYAPYAWAFQTKRGGAELYIYLPDTEYPDPGDGSDPRVLPSMGIARSVDLWAEAATGVGMVFDSNSTFDEGWSFVDATTSDLPSFLLQTYTPPTIALPSLTLVYDNPSATPGTASAQASFAQTIAGFGVTFHAGLTKWDVTGGFEYVD